MLLPQAPRGHQLCVKSCSTGLRTILVGLDKEELPLQPVASCPSPLLERHFTPPWPTPTSPVKSNGKGSPKTDLLLDESLGIKKELGLIICSPGWHQVRSHVWPWWRSGRCVMAHTRGAHQNWQPKSHQGSGDTKMINSTSPRSRHHITKSRYQQHLRLLPPSLLHAGYIYTKPVPCVCLRLHQTPPLCKKGVFGFPFQKRKLDELRGGRTL